MEAARQAREDAGRLEGLDGLRGLAAATVALYHAQWLFAPGSLANTPLPLRWLQDWGWTLVDLFFLISGFIFAHVYLTDERMTARGLRDFAVARFARLYPLHLVTLLVCAAMLGHEPDNTGAAFLAHVFMAQAWVAPAGHTFDGPSWSISIELVCYLLFAVGAVWRRALPWICVGSVTLCLLYFVRFGGGGSPWSDELLQRGLLGFFLGQLLWQARARLRRIPTGMLVTACVVSPLMVGGSVSPILPLDLLCFPAALLLALRLPLLRSRPLLWLGARSYAVYLVHFPLVELIRTAGPLPGGTPSLLIGFAAFSAVVLLVADQAHRWIEVPARRGIRRAFLPPIGPGQPSPASAR